MPLLMWIPPLSRVPLEIFAIVETCLSEPNPGTSLYALPGSFKDLCDAGVTVCRPSPGISPSSIRAQELDYGEHRRPHRQSWRHPSDHPSPYTAAESGKDRVDESSGYRSPACH